MPEDTIAVWLVAPDGASLRVTSAGVLLGRAPHCDIVLADPRASGRHALVRAGLGGAEVVALGRNPTYVNLQPVTGFSSLVHGDRLDVPGLRLDVEARGSDVTTGTHWVMQRPGGAAFSIPAASSTVGGGPGDRVRVAGWPHGAVTLGVVQGALVAELHAAGTLGEVAVAPGDAAQLITGTVLRISDVDVLFTSLLPTGETTTMAAPSEPIADEIVYERLEDGANATFRFPDVGPVIVRLDDEQAALVECLLAAAKGGSPLVSDPQLARAVWPGQAFRDSQHLTVVLRRLAERLLRAGTNPFRVLERDATSGATRLRVTPTTKLRRE